MKKLFMTFAMVIVSFIVIVNADSTVITLYSPGGSSSVDGGLSITVDAYGAFGSSSWPADDAIFNPPGSIGSAGTTYESGVFLRSPGFASFLAQGDIGGSGNLTSVPFDSTTSNEAQSHFTLNNLNFNLTQTVFDRLTGNTKTGSSLGQTYLIENPTGDTVNFSLTRYIDGDLYFVGGFSNDWGGESGLVLYEFDTGDNPNNPSTYLGINTSGSLNTSTSGGFEVSPFANLRSKIANGTPLNNSVYGDYNGDNRTDISYDVTLALQRDYVLAAHETTFFTTVTDFGYGEFGQEPIANTAEETVSNSIRSGIYAWDSGYDISFVDQTVHIILDIQLAGDDPGDALRQQWEQGIEGIWGNSYDIVDGIYTYPIDVEVNWVNTDPHHVVTVHSGAGRANMANWYTDTSAWGPNRDDEIAAHEAGHMLGVYDEYAGGALDPNTNLITTNSLMADLGPTRQWHYEQILEWLESGSGRDLSLAHSPLPPYPIDDPVTDFSDPMEPIPEPSTLALLTVGLFGVLGCSKIVPRIKKRS